MNHISKIHTVIVKYLYESLHRLKLKGLVGCIGSASFGDYRISRINNRVILSDLDLIVLLTLTSYLKYLTLKFFGKNLKLLEKIDAGGFKSSISYENPIMSWFLRRINYINFFELKIISPRTLLPEKKLISISSIQIPLINIFELYISCLADVICMCNIDSENRFCRDLIIKRIKFLGYLYCLRHDLNLVNNRSRHACLELLKSQLSEILDVGNNIEIHLIVDFFIKVFIEHILKLKLDNIVLDNVNPIDVLIYIYLSMLLKERSSNRIDKLFKYIIYSRDPIKLKVYVKYGLELPDLIRLLTLVIVKKLSNRESIHTSVLPSFCLLWKKYML